ncbi:hypothetical protein SKM52_00735 [Acinetobacter faecalis]|uniref:Uncharacterized protein n=1 Tax=Acinetobacter faecalis TaxID=2665161 RepID=A0A6L6GDP3_9GAMM|nr:MULTISPECIES: hypothetical protein [Acinetobacter]MDY6461245.1 hypothetical protein [Acinetobacter faecalis]MDY6488607.1 hypothetical protein [Acinetobacter faecalis]MDY6509849.1 hypothetical protein [Acinetobacter faecalis]MDY6523093.1 hypothetical protein [Acinetobacter faecalis]MDY6529725.1 hypothetical protein [Acinetobacter faecalis]
MQNMVFLGLEKNTFEQFQSISERLKQGTSSSIAQELGQVLAEMSCHLVDQVFGEIAKIRAHADLESENTLQQIKDNLKKYMPWAIALFSNERLNPLVEYLQTQMQCKNEQHFLTYRVDQSLLNYAINYMEQIEKGDQSYIVPAFQVFTKIVDQGIDQLIYAPKKLLKFNFVVDKTLTGVIHLTTQLGYKRIEKVSTQFAFIHAQKTLMHFFSFLEQPNQPST